MNATQGGGRLTFRVGPDADPDRYALGPAVASGAEGILYRKSITTVNRVELAVAIKMLQPRLLPHMDEWRNRWSEQVELLRSLQVPGVVRVRDGSVGPLPHPPGEPGEGRTLYLVMNWEYGEPLDEWVRRRPDSDPIDSLRVLLPVAAALDLMHSGSATGGPHWWRQDHRPGSRWMSRKELVGALAVHTGLEARDVDKALKGLTEVHLGGGKLTCEGRLCVGRNQPLQELGGVLGWHRVGVAVDDLPLALLTAKHGGGSQRIGQRW